MIAQIIEPKKIGRNEPCLCGKTDDAGKVLKYKKCCMVKRGRQLTQQGFQNCFKKLVKDAGGSLDITLEDLDALPRDEALAIGYNVEEDLFHFKVVKIKKSPILTIDKRIKA